MNYYNKHIGDYHKKAGRLTMIEHGAYNLLIDACYDRERFPTMDEAIQWCWARTEEEVNAVKFVLSRFFTLKNGVYEQKRINEEVDKYKTIGLINQLTALSREAKKKNGPQAFISSCDELKNEIKDNPTYKTHAAWSSVIDALKKEHDHSPNQEPITINHKPITNIKNTCAEKSAHEVSQDQLHFENKEINSRSGDELFEKFWCAGMRKVGGKPATKKVFDRLVKKQKDPVQFVDMLCRDIERRMEACQNGFDLLHPKTYLNGHRWEDELPEVRSELQDHPEFEFFDLAHLYNEKLGHHFGRISNITPGRQSEILQSISFEPDKRKKLEWWGRCFDAIGHSVLINPSENGWRPNFDFLIKSDTIEKLREGRYAIK